MWQREGPQKIFGKSKSRNQGKIKEKKSRKTEQIINYIPHSFEAFQVFPSFLRT